MIFLIDEAYADFAPGSSDVIVKKYKNVVISRTFSKSMGAAGARIGYLLGSEQIISAASKLKLTFPLTQISTKFGIKLMENINIFKEYANQTIEERNKIYKMFDDSNYDVINSNCNWIHFNDKNNNNYAQGILESYGVGYKNLARIPNDDRDNWIRLAVGPGMSENKFIKKLLLNGKKYET